MIRKIEILLNLPETVAPVFDHDFPTMVRAIEWFLGPYTMHIVHCNAISQEVIDADSNRGSVPGETETGD